MINHRYYVFADMYHYPELCTTSIKAKFKNRDKAIKYAKESAYDVVEVWDVVEEKIILEIDND